MYTTPAASGAVSVFPGAAEKSNAFVYPKVSENVTHSGANWAATDMSGRSASVDFRLLDAVHNRLLLYYCPVGFEQFSGGRNQGKRVAARDLRAVLRCREVREPRVDPEQRFGNPHQQSGRNMAEKGSLAILNPDPTRAIIAGQCPNIARNHDAITGTDTRLVARRTHKIATSTFLNQHRGRRSTARSHDQVIHHFYVCRNLLRRLVLRLGYRRPRQPRILRQNVDDRD